MALGRCQEALRRPVSTWGEKKMHLTAMVAVMVVVVVMEGAPRHDGMMKIHATG